MGSKNRNSLDQSQLTPYALSLQAKSVSTADVPQTRDAVPLREVATLVGLAEHPLVGEKFPGINPSPPTWPANKEISAQAESWFIVAPAGYSADGDPRPLVVVINQAGVPYTGIQNSILQAEVLSRGWLFMSLKCISALTFPSEISRLSVDASIEWAAANYNIDRRRIFFLGASRGAGILASHAATRQALVANAPAAVVLFSPLLELRQYWSKLSPLSGTAFGADDNAGVTTRAQSERPDNAAGAWGDSPAVDHRFRTGACLHYQVGTYAEHPSISGDPGAVVDETRSIGRCLANVNTWLIWDPLDAVAVIPTSCVKLRDLLQMFSGLLATQTAVGSGGHGFALLDAVGGVTSVEVCDWLESQALDRTPMPLHVCTPDDVPYGITRPYRAVINDTARYDVRRTEQPDPWGFDITNVVRLARLDIDVHRDPVLRSYVATVGAPLTISVDAGCAIRLLGLAFTPTVINQTTGILTGGLGVGYTFGIDGTKSVEVINSGTGPMEFSVY